MKLFMIFILLLISIPLEIVLTACTFGIYYACMEDNYISFKLIDKL